MANITAEYCAGAACGLAEAEPPFSRRRTTATVLNIGGTTGRSDDVVLRDVDGAIVDSNQHRSPTRRLQTERTGHLRTAGRGHRSFGFNASRSQSPSRLTTSTSAVSAILGKRTIQYSPDIRKSLPT